MDKLEAMNELQTLSVALSQSSQTPVEESKEDPEEGQSSLTWWRGLQMKEGSEDNPEEWKQFIAEPQAVVKVQEDVPEEIKEAAFGKYAELKEKTK